MGLGKWLNGFFYGNDETGQEPVKIDVATEKQIQVICYKYLAINTCINFISSIISLSNFQTYKSGKLFDSRESYRFNIEPNQNEGSTAFWRRVVSKLVNDGECLVVKLKSGSCAGEYHVAESFERKEYALKPNTYTKVILGTENPYQLNDVFYESDVFFFRWNNMRLSQYVDGVYNDLGQLIEAAKDNYLLLSKLKVLIKQSATTPLTDKFSVAIQELVNNNLQAFLDPSKSNALPLRKGVEYEDVSKHANGTSTNAANDVKTLIREGISMTAMAFQISPQLLLGDIAGIDDAYRITMTTCIKPLINILSDEINRKLYGFNKYSHGTRLFIDISNVSYTDLKDVANALEVLTRISVNTLDDNLRVLGREPIGGDEGARRLITKNYVSTDWLDSDEAQGTKAPMKGGE